MSLYDLVFYFFSEYIDDNSGEFEKDFFLPPRFNLFRTQQGIKDAIWAIENEPDVERQHTVHCPALLDLFHQSEMGEDEYWSWKAGAVSEVCYASGTTKKIDLMSIKEHFGSDLAAAILTETLLAAKSIWEHRDTDLYADEPFLFEDSNGHVRYIQQVLGLTWDPQEGRPDLDVDVESFYKFEKAYLNDINDLPARVSDAVYSSWRGDANVSSGRN